VFKTLVHQEPDIVPWGEHYIDYNVVRRQQLWHNRIVDTFAAGTALLKLPQLAMIFFPGSKSLDFYSPYQSFPFEYPVHGGL
ncbi:unnamed protein product, partial [marine sediment metagenome]